MNQRDNIHPILRQMDPSTEQEKPILSRGQDIVVTAGAGTGKTRTLVARYLSLLVDGIPLRSIVAITFTKKAAREMRNRIREEVRTYLERKELKEEDLVFWREVYESLDAARISTIHSLAADILRQHPAEMNLDPQFELLDEGYSARLKSQAVEASLVWAGQDDSVSILFSTYGDWKLRRVINELLSKRLDILAVLDQAPIDLWKKWRPLLIRPLKEFVEHPVVQAGLDGLLSLEGQGIVNQAEAAGDLLVKDLRIVNKQWENVRNAHQNEDWVEISRSLGPLRSHLKQKGRQENWAPAKPRAVIKEIQAIYDGIIGYGNLDLELDRKLAREIIPALGRCFLYADRWYSSAKEQVIGLDFDDLEKKALNLLQEYPQVKQYWQEQIQALLVDEYQDTNDRQRELVNHLRGEGNNLFIVGDGKQSIYRFRGADVAVFRQEQEAIREKGNSFHLPSSYRAHPVLLQNLNTLLEPVLGTEDDLPYVEPFAELKPGRQDSPRINDPPYIELHLAAGTKADGAGKIAAEAVAARLIEIFTQEKGKEKIKKGKNPLTFGDAAILCRASNSFPAFEAAFEKAGIPYLTIAGQGFYDRPEIRDLLNALQVFADPQNDLAVAGLMRSPVVGLADDLLLQIRDFQKEREIPSLIEAARQIKDIDKRENNLRIQELISLVDSFGKLVGRITAAEIISQFVDQTGYLAALVLNGQYRGVQNIKKLVTDAQNSGIVNISEFLNTIAELRNVSIREGEAQAVAEGAVQIMTVHQSKGLEFPIVVLGDASKKERFGRDILVDDKLGFVIPFSEKRIVEDSPAAPEITTASSLAYELASAEERLKEDAESNRLLYVAATRAQEMLIISGTLGKPTKDQKMAKLSGWLGKLALPLGLSQLTVDFQIDGNKAHHRELDFPGLNASLNIYESGMAIDLFIQPILDELDADEMEDFPVFQDILLDEGQKISDWKLEENQIYRVTSDSKRAHVPARVVGEIVHKALERWIFPSNGEADFINWAETEFRELGLVTEKEIQNGYNRARKILERFQDSDLFQRMDNAELLKHEVPFSVMGDQNSVFKGSIDALFRERNHWVLVEFKTDEIRDQKGFDWIWEHEDYQDQVANYLRAAKKILGEQPKPVLCFLNYEKRIHLVTDCW